MRQLLKCGACGLVGVLCCLPVRAQAPAWQSVLAVSPLNLASTGSAAVTATAADASGNVYLAGTLNGTIQVGGTTLTSAGTNDGFVAKWSSTTNTFAWAQRLGGSEMDDVRALAVVGSAVYIAGSFSSYTATFGGLTLPNAAGSSDGYVAKLTDAGSSATFAWVQRVGGTGADAANTLAVAGAAVYVAGSFSSPTLALGATTLSTTGPERTYVARLTDAGSTSSWAWAVQNGGSGLADISALALSSTATGTGPVVTVAGTFEGTTTFGNPVSVLTSVGGRDVLVAQLVDTGLSTNYIWAAQMGGSTNDFGAAVAVVGSSVYVAGNFTSPTSSFGPLALANTSTNGGFDAFVAKLTPLYPGTTFNWVQPISGISSDQVGSLVARGTSVYVAGSFGSPTAILGPLAVANSSLPGFADVFVARLLDAGGSSSFVWAQPAGGADADYGQALAVSGPNLYVGGSAKLPATFGNLVLASANGGTPITGFVGILADAVGLAATPAAALAGLRAYPNPAAGTATVRVPASTGPASLTLLDVLGRVVRTQPASAGADATLDLAGLAPGVYALRVQAGAAVATQQLVVQ